jgi:hypothetical protein
MGRVEREGSRAKSSKLFPLFDSSDAKGLTGFDLDNTRRRRERHMLLKRQEISIACKHDRATQ